MGAYFVLHSLSLTQQNLDSGYDDLGCVRRIKHCSIPEIFFNKICVDAKLELNFLFSDNYDSFSYPALNFNFLSTF